MEHSVIFGDGSMYPSGDRTKMGYMMGINTWDDWHLIPSSRPQIAPPEVYTNYVDLPAAHGKLDLSEYLTGAPVYKNRTGSLEFIFANGYGFWAERHNQIYNFLHGKKLYMSLWDEPEYYYYGRFKVQKPNSDGKTNWTTVTIDYELDPFKFRLPPSINLAPEAVNPLDVLDEYWDRFLLDDTHTYEYMRKLDASERPSFVIPGYDNGFMLDAFISDETPASVFPATATIQLNHNVSQTIVITKSAPGEPTVHTTGNIIPVTNSQNIVTLDGTGLVDLIFWGGSL